jgi:hypothetical protein
LASGYRVLRAVALPSGVGFDADHDRNGARNPFSGLRAYDW